MFDSNKNNKNPQPHKESLKVLGSDYVFETGSWAKQANGSVLIRWNNIALMANATAAKSANVGTDFFPLTVDYREKFYSTGRFSGGFFKREGKPSNKEILTSRLVDRPLRPLFPPTFFNELQIFISLLSADDIHSSDIHAVTCASAALMVSNIPFDGPVAGVRVGRIDGNFIIFPTKDQQKKSELNLLLAGTEKAVTMIEGMANELSEDIMLEAVKFGHAEIKRICEAQHALRQYASKEILSVPDVVKNIELETEVNKLAFDKMVKANISNSKKHDRQNAIDAIFDETLEAFQTKWEAESVEKSILEGSLNQVKTILQDIEVNVVRDQIFTKSIRADHRKLDEIRPISIDVGVLPSVHGSALFTRGETQSLGVVTLGTENDAQVIDGVEEDTKEFFYLHYNFLPFSVGEVRRYGGPGRREVGHGKLAENAVTPVIPSFSKFPYVIRVVSEILESNGSSSMATVCSASLSLMDAGVPIANPVAGIAMGLITDEKSNKYAILSDIAGLEDHFGDMDFKVAGTKNGITAFQLDTKVQGISYQIMEEALKQARTGFLSILDIMNDTISTHRSKVSDSAPGISVIKIDKEQIGELIGSGGSNIRALTEKTGAEIIINDDGVVNIYSKSQEAVLKAKELIELQFQPAEVDKVYDGVVQRLSEFGAFIEILPGKVGLCHVSKISTQRVDKVEDVLKVGDKVKVKLLAIDKQGRYNLSIKDV